LTWSEHYVVNNSTAASGPTSGTVNMVLHVQP